MNQEKEEKEKEKKVTENAENVHERRSTFVGTAW
jgi:hypothetical protein